jgi:hypothetical protein
MRRNSGAPAGAKEPSSCERFRRSAAWLVAAFFPWLAPWAISCRHSVAQLRRISLRALWLTKTSPQHLHPKRTPSSSNRINRGIPPRVSAFRIPRSALVVSATESMAVTPDHTESQMRDFGLFRVPRSAFRVGKYQLPSPRSLIAYWAFPAVLERETASKSCTRVRAGGHKNIEINPVFRGMSQAKVRRSQPKEIL